MRLIDADALLERIRNGSNDADWYYEDLVEKSPTVDPLRHGHWIFETEWFGSLGLNYKKCSACGKRTQGIPSKGQVIRYCEDCGAKMDEKGAVTYGEDKG